MSQKVGDLKMVLESSNQWNKLYQDIPRYRFDNELPLQEMREGNHKLLVYRQMPLLLFVVVGKEETINQSELQSLLNSLLAKL